MSATTVTVLGFRGTIVTSLEGRSVTVNALTTEKMISVANQGPPGIDGSASKDSFTDSSDHGHADYGNLQGSVDGVNRIFNLSEPNVIAKTLKVTIGSSRQSAHEVTDVSSSEFTMAFAPPAGATVLADYEATI